MADSTCSLGRAGREHLSSSIGVKASHQQINRQPVSCGLSPHAGLLPAGVTLKMASRNTRHQVGRAH